VRSLREPSGQSFEDHTPDGRWFRILRRRVAAGGTITVMTDITEQKQAARDLATKEAELHVALDNMPGALVYTDDDLNIVFCNDRFREMYLAPPRSSSSRDGHTRSSCAISPPTATTARATSTRWWRGGSRACGTPPEKASRITRPMVAGFAFSDPGRPRVARSP
jgi:PAS domain-containing protein